MLNQQQAEQDIHKLAEKLWVQHGRAAEAEAKRMAIGLSAMKDEPKARLYLQVLREIKRRYVA